MCTFIYLFVYSVLLAVICNSEINTTRKRFAEFIFDIYSYCIYIDLILTVLSLIFMQSK